MVMAVKVRDWAEVRGRRRRRVRRWERATSATVDVRVTYAVMVAGRMECLV